MTDDALITLDEAAKLIPGADANTLKRMQRKGVLRCYRPGRASHHGGRRSRRRQKVRGRAKGPQAGHRSAVAARFDSNGFGQCRTGRRVRSRDIGKKETLSGRR